MKALCEGLSELGVWTRLHYVYPYPHVDDVIPLMADGKLLPYLDIPFQHASPRVLKLMKRPARSTRPWSASSAGARSARTDHPQHLHRRLPRRDRSRVRGAAGLPRRSPARSRRRVRLFAGGRRPGQRLAGSGARRRQAGAPGALHGAQAAISEARLAAKVGSVQRCWSMRSTASTAIARSMADAPEIDGLVQIQDGREAGLQPGEFADVRIMGSDEHDLYGEVEYDD
jgi:ribosomal protein S12 methylthiotransferase